MLVQQISWGLFSRWSEMPRKCVEEGEAKVLEARAPNQHSVTSTTSYLSKPGTKLEREVKSTSFLDGRNYKATMWRAHIEGGGKDGGHCGQQCTMNGLCTVLPDNEGLEVRPSVASTAFHLHLSKWLTWQPTQDQSLENDELLENEPFWNFIGAEPRWRVFEAEGSMLKILILPSDSG